jgi:DNA-binding NarL/FixJ family response regulator
MRRRRVVLLNNRSLFVAGVERLLQGVDDVELNVVPVDHANLATEVKRFAPHIIILDSGAAQPSGEAIVGLLAEHPKAKVVGLNLNEPAMKVFRMRQVRHMDLEGLLEVIRG